MNYQAEHQIEQLVADFGEADVFPVVTRMPGDLLTPLGAYLAVASGSDHSFLFESVEGGEHLARYSFLGADPEIRLRESGEKLLIEMNGNEESVDAQMLDHLRTMLTGHRMPLIEDLPSFAGGAVGFLDFSYSEKAEPVLTRSAQEKPGRAGSEFMIFRSVIAFDHVKQVVNIVTLVFSDEAKGDLNRFRELVKSAIGKNEEIVRTLSNFVSATHQQASKSITEKHFESNFSQTEFEKSVLKIKELILAGECYQVVLSQCLTRRTEASPVAIYRALRSLNPSPYMFLLRLAGRSVIGASPEMLVRSRGGELEYCPIAGTRPRGSDPKKDEELGLEMLADQKECAEHTMLVDLGRNDLGRVAKYGSVEVKSLMKVEKFSHVQHLVSYLKAELRDELDCFDALISCFPAGTVSGAPKVKALEVINRLEPTERGIYAGAVGYFDYAGNLDTCIAIRTIVVEDGIAKIQAGAGIVADSIPENEYAETLQKARALTKAVEMAETGYFGS